MIFVNIKKTRSFQMYL